MTDYFVRDDPTMPSSGKTPQSVNTAGSFEHSAQALYHGKRPASAQIGPVSELARHGESFL